METIKIVIIIILSPILIPLCYIFSEPWIKWYYEQNNHKRSYNRITGIVKDYWREEGVWILTRKIRRYGYSGLCNYSTRYI